MQYFNKIKEKFLIWKWNTDNAMIEKKIKELDKYKWTEEVPTKPKYYQTKDLDVIDICKILNLNFNRGNILKYISRAGKKENESEVKDLLKAKDYLEREIKHLEKQLSENK